MREVLGRSGVAGADVGHVAVGHVINTEPRDMYLSRVAAINAGIGQATPAFNVNRLCGSGLQAIISAAQSLLLGDAKIAIGEIGRAPSELQSLMRISYDVFCFKKKDHAVIVLEVKGDSQASACLNKTTSGHGITHDIVAHEQ